MSDETTEGTAASAVLRTLADQVNWLIDQTRPAGREPCTNAEVAALIERATGEPVSHTTVWKLRNAALLLQQIGARQIGARALSAQCRVCSIHAVCGGGMYSHRYREGTGFAQALGVLPGPHGTDQPHPGPPRYVARGMCSPQPEPRRSPRSSG
jgi:hypothetical protein